MFSHLNFSFAILISIISFGFAQPDIDPVIEVELTLSGTELYYTSTEELGGLQFNIAGCESSSIDISGGAMSDNGFTPSCGLIEGVYGCMFFNFSGGTVPETDTAELLLDLGTTCTNLTGIIVSNPAGIQLDHEFTVTSAGGCDDPSACNDGSSDDCTYPSDDNHNCDGSCGGVNGATVDCNGVCGGGAIVDDCNICGGDGSSCSNP